MHSESDRIVGTYRRRISILLAVCAACALAGVLYVHGHIPARDESTEHTDESALVTDDLMRLRSRPHLVFVEQHKSSMRPRLAFAPLDDPEQGQIITRLECQRVYAAGRRLLCLRSVREDEGRMETDVFVLDESLRTTRSLPLVGIPSRVRASSDGSFGAVTLFTAGDSYAAAGFSTRTYVIKLTGQEPIFDLERLHITHQGKRYDSVDFNYWGVTFLDSPTHFFASLGSGGSVRLVEASLDDAQGRTLHEHVECPSLSPDRTRICYKRLSSNLPPNRWALALLDLSTSNERILQGEQHSVDDQVEWLDAHHVLYRLGAADDYGGGSHSDLWILDVDVDGPARVFLKNASSPSVVRP